MHFEAERQVMITKLGEHRGYELFYQECSDFIGIYTQPNIGYYLGQTLAQATATIDAMLDEQEDDENILDEAPAGWCDSEQPIII